MTIISIYRRSSFYLRYDNRDWKYRDKSKYRNIAQPYMCISVCLCHWCYWVHIYHIWLSLTSIFVFSLNYFPLEGVLAERLFATFDKDKNNVIDFEEFLGELFSYYYTHAQEARGAEVGVRTFPQMFCYSSQNSCTYTLLPSVKSNNGSTLL